VNNDERLRPSLNSQVSGRSRVRKFLPLVFALIPLVVVAYVAGRSPRGLRPFLLVGQAAPVVSAVALDGVAYESSRKGWQLVHFWTTTCSECRGEIPELRRFLEKTKGTAAEIELLNVNIQDEIPVAAKYAAQYGVPPVVLVDTDGKMARSYGVMGVPESFFVDAKGIVRHHLVGAASTEEFERVFEILRNAQIP
jgi:cytochrome c biogenesis protein CcmG/thiol:disulfide interchange protein DsbE